ncbi:hypothetical protein FHU36_001755 [Nonomuraea muscovyensis]|uniref:Uncharacterized protein n=1 Tax=Nonomuraea muscovyensis TaxID=1124761 RepID=A0A7X0EY19_9ACTN|nr:hypothetical protein [Nonomuraea muscovyensis]MBB6345246.1 hypothetical protein [Nonomuraea muscovyensis]
MKGIFPYQVVLGEVTLAVDGAWLDDLPVPIDMISPIERAVALHDIQRPDWRAARLSVRVRGPEQELATGPWGRMSCVAMLTERRTNAHSAVRLRMVEPGEWVGYVELRRDHHGRRAELGACLVATVDDIPGRLIGAVDSPWTIDVQARTPVRREDVTTRWVDFGDDRHPWLRAYRSDPWAIDTTGDPPVLYLNSGFEGLRLLLESTRQSERAARDALAARIAMDMWSVLFDAAADQVDGSEWPVGWRGSVLRRMLPDVFPDCSPEDALRELAGASGGELRSRVLHAAAKQARMPATLGTFIRALHRTGHEEEQ